MARRLLLLAYFYPPFGGAGVQRALKLSRLAEEFAWQVDVVSATPGPDELKDPSLLTEVPGATEVDRPPVTRLPQALGPLRRLQQPDIYRLWAGPAMAAAETRLASGRYDAMMSTSLPYTSHKVALELRQRHALPWVADLRDPWTDNRFLRHYQDGGLYARWRRRVDGALEREVYAGCDLLTMTAEPLRALLMARHGVAADKALLVRNGYDEDDFAETPNGDGMGSKPADGRPFEILFAGSIYQGYTIEPALQAMEVLLERAPDTPLMLCLHTQAGAWLDANLPRFPRVAARSVRGQRLAHREIIARYQQADLLILSALDDLSIPGKLFEYMRSGRPVLAFVDRGAEADTLLRQTGCGDGVNANDVEAGVAALQAHLQGWQRGTPRNRPDLQAVAAFERRAQFRNLFVALDRLVATGVGPLGA